MRLGGAASVVQEGEAAGHCHGDGHAEGPLVGREEGGGGVVGGLGGGREGEGEGKEWVQDGWVRVTGIAAPSFPI